MAVLANWSSGSWEQAREAIKRDLLSLVTVVNNRWVSTFGDGAQLQPNAAPAEVTFAQRELNPVVGALQNFSDSSTATWGATVAGNSTNRILARFNGTVWTVVGK